ncbi:ABC transporter permease, partial [Streptomyces sp. NPDC017673]|uniref:ABC transporter permease n=1 Tax=unclassified Streptomyces TaxID=2593676 RepID=UPI00378C23ED
MPEQPHEPTGAIAGTGMGGSMDLAADEAAGLERAVGGPGGGAPRSLWSDAWRDLRRNPVFVVSALVILFLVFISIWPSAIASGNPLKCDLAKAQDGSAPGHPFGYDGQGCDVYTRTVYGARTSVTVGVLATLGVSVFGSVLGGLAGYFGGLWDSVLSRITDIFFAIP